MIRLFFLFAAFQLIHQPLTAQISPEEYFGDSYVDALNYCQENRAEFSRFFLENGIKPEVACAVIFPELIRYNRFRNFIETTALEIAYISGGKNVADFSIGRFQMKPSFVEMIENELNENLEIRLQFEKVVNYQPFFSETEVRKERLERLNQPSWQKVYLACFLKLALKKYEVEIEQNPQDVLLILSSAYNLGLQASYADLKRIAETKTFPYGKNFTGRFSYFDVANYFYSNHSNLIAENL